MIPSQESEESGSEADSGSVADPSRDGGVVMGAPGCSGRGLMSVSVMSGSASSISS